MRGAIAERTTRRGEHQTPHVVDPFPQQALPDGRVLAVDRPQPIQRIATEPAMRELALHVLTDDKRQLAGVPVALYVSTLNDADLAVRAAEEQSASEGARTSGFDEWLEAQRVRRRVLVEPAPFPSGRPFAPTRPLPRAGTSTL